MGIRAYGQLCFGVIVPDDITLPWNAENEYGENIYDGEINDWWLDISGYVSPYTSWEEEGYFEHKRTYLTLRPTPVEVVYYGDVDYPNYLIALKGSYTRASSGEIEEINYTTIFAMQYKKDELINFCKKHLGIDNPEPKWYLTSNMG